MSKKQKLQASLNGTVFAIVEEPTLTSHEKLKEMLVDMYFKKGAVNPKEIVLKPL